jgi:hypothetical protein
VSLVILSGMKERAFLVIVEICGFGNIQWGDGNYVCDNCREM